MPTPEQQPRPRLLACDVDGTLLDAERRLRPVVRDALLRVAATGVRIVLVTGRAPWDGIAGLAERLGLPGPHITMQGALISDPASGLVERLRPLPVTTFLDGLRFADELGLEPVVGLADGHRSRRAAAGVEFLAQWPGRHARVDDLRSLTGQVPIRLYLPTGPMRHRHIRAAASVWFARHASIVWSDLEGIELLGPGAHKGAALAWLATQLGLDAAEVAAVGDGPNDMTMLAYAGRSAAMGGSASEVASFADIAVPSSHEDGILSALAWFFPDLALELVPGLSAPSLLHGAGRRRADPRYASLAG